MSSVLMLEPHGRGGIHAYSVALGAALVARGQPVDLLTTLAAETGPAGAGGLSVLRALHGFTDVAGGRRSPRRRAASLRRHLANARETDSWSRSPEVGLVHLQWPLLRFAAVTARRIAARRPLVVTVHNVTPHDAASQPAAGAWPRVYDSADVLVCHTPETVDDLCARYGERLRPRAGVIAHGVGDPAWDPPQSYRRDRSRRRLELPAGAHLTLFFGAIRPYKGLELLLQAWSAVAEAYPAARLVIAGACEDWTPYARLIVQLGLPDRVIARIGWVDADELPHYLTACDAVALPHRRIEASGVAAAAAYFGTPLLLADIAGFRATWRPDEALFVARDARSWAAAVAAVAGDPATAAARARRAQDRAVGELSWDAVAGLHLDAYDEARGRFSMR